MPSGIGEFFILEASTPSDYLLADAIYHEACEGATWLFPGQVAGEAYLIWNEPPDYLRIIRDLNPGKIPPTPTLEREYGGRVHRASVLAQQGTGMDRIRAAKGNGHASDLSLMHNPTPTHTLQILANSVGLTGAIYPPRWRIPRPQASLTLVHAGQEMAVPGSVQPIDALMEVAWPAGTATIGTKKDRLIPGTQDLRTDSRKEIRAAIRAATTFVGIPTIMAYHAAACSIRTCCVFPQDAMRALWQSRGVNIWGQTDIIGDADCPVKIEAWLSGLLDEALPGLKSIGMSPHRPHLYPRAGEGPRFHPGQGLK